jgi:hypothetical protein
VPNKDLTLPNWLLLFPISCKEGIKKFHIQKTESPSSRLDWPHAHYPPKAVVTSEVAHLREIAKVCYRLIAREL